MGRCANPRRPARPCPTCGKPCHSKPGNPCRACIEAADNDDIPADVLDRMIAEQLPTMSYADRNECEYVAPGTVTGRRKRSLTPVAWERGCRHEFVRDRRMNGYYL